MQIETLTGRVAALSAQLAGQVSRIEELERRLGSDSLNSSKPASSDMPYRKPGRTSSRTSSGRKPGKQPGSGGAAEPPGGNPHKKRLHDAAPPRGRGAD